jgi:hypothetical protein
MNNPTHLLQDIASNIQKKLLAELAQSQPIKHPGTKGDSTEAVWISLFRDYLPTRFRIAKGIVVDCEGSTSQQIDCVIFDSQFTPQIIPDEDSLYIPVEAVHAAFEVKQKVNKEHLSYAAGKVKSVRQLIKTSSAYIGDGRKREKKDSFHILGGLLAQSCDFSEKLDSTTFYSTISQLKDDEHLDFVFSAEDGYADLVRSDGLLNTNKEDQIRNDGSPFIIEGNTGINYGLIRLLEELSWQGTVQAVEWPRYLKNLAKPKTIEIPE